MRFLWIVAGLALTGLALLGAMLPVLPSTPFALLAAACFARSSPRLERWLLAHKTIAPAVRAWRAERAIPRSAKIVALGSMAISAVVVVTTTPAVVAAVSLVALAGAALYVGTRPLPSPHRPV